MKHVAVYVLLLVMALLSIYATTASLISFDLGAFFVFVLILAALIFRDRKKVKLEGILFIRRTKKGRDFIDRTAKRSPRFWNTLAVLGVIIGIPLLIIGSVFIASQAIGVAQSGAEGGVRLLLPGPVSSPINAPGIFVVPWWIWVIGIAVVIIPHEFMHGIVCRLHKIPIKSVGWILLVIIPGAFVEPDEAKLKKAKKSVRMKVYAAGSFANMIVAAIVILIFVFSFPMNFQPGGVFVNTAEGGPANEAGLQGMIIAVDGQEIQNLRDIQLSLQGRKPGETVTVTTAGPNLLVPKFGGAGIIIPEPVAATDRSEINEYTITLTEHPENPEIGYAGIFVSMEGYEYTGDSLEGYNMVFTVLLWIFVFSFGIGLVNLLPIKPLDGGLLFEEIVGDRSGARHAVIGMSLVMVALIIFNLIGPIFV